jgi:hypothetical protein
MSFWSVSVLAYLTEKQPTSSVLKIINSVLSQHGVKTGCDGLPERSHVSL